MVYTVPIQVLSFAPQSPFFRLCFVTEKGFIALLRFLIQV